MNHHINMIWCPCQEQNRHFADQSITIHKSIYGSGFFVEFFFSFLNKIINGWLLIVLLLPCQAAPALELANLTN